MPTYWQAEYERRRSDLLARLADATNWRRGVLEADLTALVNAHAQWQRELATPDEPAFVRVPRPRYRPLEFGPLPPAPKLGLVCDCHHWWMIHSDVEPHACRPPCACSAFHAATTPGRLSGLWDEARAAEALGAAGHPPPPGYNPREDDPPAMEAIADVPPVGAMPDMVSYATAKALADAFDDAIAAATREPWQMLAVSPRRPWWRRALEWLGGWPR